MRKENVNEPQNQQCVQTSVSGSADVMKTVNSISGGKTSSYLAKHYPADYNLFSLVRIEDKECTPKDKKLVQLVSDKIGMEFIATAESDLTLKVVLDLEQLIGTEIKWLTGKTFEQIIKDRSNYLPNQMTRFCTTEMKMRPIANFCRDEIKEIVSMRLGIRYDENHRVDYSNTDFKFHNGYSKNGRNKWKTEKYRELDYYLVDNQIEHYIIFLWSLSTNIEFPPDSNCVGCFHKPVQQLRKNWDDESLKMQWFANQEIGRKKFKKEMKYETIKKIGLQTDFIFGTGSGCNSGACHN
jgi:3'-phosphoadenosine 5'-phosphosulfate sulfotransferase (PAPS reductase)/FAD synthetase